MPHEDSFMYKVLNGLKSMPYWQIAALAVLVVLLAVAAFLLLRQPGRAAVVVEPEKAAAVDEGEPVEFVVYVTGAVLRPGVYRAPDVSRVGDALQLAGGTTADADLSQLNLAARLHDGEKIAVPRVGETPPPSAGGSTGGGETVNLNTASAAQLDQVPGIGPVLAERIIDFRESHGGFQSIQELNQVEGIGPKKFEDLKDRVEI